MYDASGSLQGRSLLFAHIVWGLMTFLAVVTLLMGLSIYYTDLSNQLAADVASQEIIGLSANFVTIYIITFEMVFAISFISIGMLIFWLRNGSRIKSAYKGER